MEIWGKCNPCDRWFYCERYTDRTSPAPTCPVCGAEPLAIVNRAAGSSLTPQAPAAV